MRNIETKYQYQHTRAFRVERVCNFIQSENIIDICSHIEFPNGTKILEDVDKLHFYQVCFQWLGHFIVINRLQCLKFTGADDHDRHTMMPKHYSTFSSCPVEVTILWLKCRSTREEWQCTFSNCRRLQICKTC